MRAIALCVLFLSTAGSMTAGPWQGRAVAATMEDVDRYLKCMKPYRKRNAEGRSIGRRKCLHIGAIGDVPSGSARHA